MNVTELWFSGSHDGIVVTYAKVSESYARGSSTTIRDLALTTDSTGYAGLTINGHADSGNAEKQTNILHVATRGHETGAGVLTSYWGRDIRLEDVQNALLDGVTNFGCSGCEATAGTAVTYNSTLNPSSATQMQITDWYVQWKEFGLDVTNYPQGITVANANIVGVDVGIRWNSIIAEAVCNLNNVQVRAQKTAVSLTNCTQGSISSGTFYVGGIGSLPVNSPIVRLSNTTRMNISSNAFFNVGLAGGSAVCIQLTGPSPANNIIGSNEFNGCTTDIAIGASASNTLISDNKRENAGSPLIVDGGGGTISNNSIDDRSWIAFAPTLTCGGGRITTGNATGRYKQIGKTIAIQINTTITTAGTCSSILVSLPFSPQSSAVISGRENGSSGRSVVGVTSGANLIIVDYTGAASVGNGYAHALTGTYEAQ